MADDMPSPPLVYEGLDPTPAPKSAIEEVSDAVKLQVGDAKSGFIGVYCELRLLREFNAVGGALH